MAERRYCKNTVPGRQGRGKKYPAKVRAEVVMAMIGTNSICAVARKYGVPESTIAAGWQRKQRSRTENLQKHGPKRGGESQPGRRWAQRHR